MSDVQTQERTSAAERARTGATKPLSNGEATAAQIFAGLRVPNFAPGFSAAADSWSSLVRAAESINREQAAIFNEDVAAVTAELEALRRSEIVPDVTQSLLKCAQLHTDLTVHGSRVVSDIMRQTWFEILSRWSLTVRSPLPDFPGSRVPEPAPSNRSR